MEKPTITELDKSHIELANNFMVGRIGLNEYLSRRGFNGYDNCNEFNYLIQKTLVFNEIIKELPPPIGALIMKNIQKLSQDEMKFIAQVGKSLISKIFEYVPEEEKRKSGYDLLAKVSIILDLPFSYLAKNSNSSIKYDSDSSFDEYYIAPTNEFSSIIGLQRYINNVFNEKNNNRYIFGAKIINTGLFKNEGNVVFTRVDIRRNFINVEFHVKHEDSLAIDSIRKIIKDLKLGNVNVLVNDCFLRKYKKYIFTGTLNTESSTHDLDLFIKKNMLRDDTKSFSPFLDFK
ncbi:hypothetical protein [Pontibacillus yanchengensis]|uniref:Uncharacterized protein n=1 Tax=Pontibacillus yanchengensis Y32 TaxID=1385514 RepID=A0A0A2TDZ2_9BACI|nr:hypothetical protein [Pontibacillus yanchengensis]KGP73754.1 hypothetical protein N782_02360 [Pontibacillus yanchengensis Y32]